MRTAYLYPSITDNLKCALGFLQSKRAFSGPHTVMIDIEDNCDLNCIMCYSHSPLLEKEEGFQRLDYDAYRNILKDLRGIGTRKISICGRGEPFLHPKILDIIKLAKQMKFYINIFTNGIHIDKNFLTEIFKLDQITFSLHAGDKETYYKVHPQAGEECFEHTRYILGQIRDYKHKNNRVTPWVKIINVIFNLNYHTIDEMFAFAEEFEVNEIMFKPAQLTRKQNILKMDSIQIDYLTQTLRKWQDCGINPVRKIRRGIRPRFLKAWDNSGIGQGVFSNGIKNNISSYLATIMQDNCRAELSQKAKVNKRTCYVPWYQSVILSNGDVAACPYNQTVLGNINKDSFKTIWFSSGYNRFRKTLDCGDCAANAVYPYLRKFKDLFRWRIKK